MSGLVLGGGALGIVGVASPVNAAPIRHPFALPVAVPKAGSTDGLTRLLATTRDARTAQLSFNVFVQNSTPYAGNETLSWQGAGVAGFKNDSAAVSYQGLFYKILASSQAVVINSKLYVHHVGLSVDPDGFNIGSPLAAASSKSGQWLEGPLPDGPLGVATANAVSLLGDLNLMLTHGATVDALGHGQGYVITLPKNALIALYEAHGLPARTAKADVASLGHFTCEIEAIAGGPGAGNKLGEIGFFLESSLYGQTNELAVYAGYDDYGISVSVVAPPKNEVRWAPGAADENLTI